MSGKAVKKQKLTPGGEAERLVKQCAGVLKAMQRNPAAGPFLAPVDWRALKLPTYPKMIKTPMDLGTVETKLNGGKYATVADFAADVELKPGRRRLRGVQGRHHHGHAKHAQSGRPGTLKACLNQDRLDAVQQVSTFRLGLKTGQGREGGGRIEQVAPTVCGPWALHQRTKGGFSGLGDRTFPSGMVDVGRRVP